MASARVRNNKSTAWTYRRWVPGVLGFEVGPEACAMTPGPAISSEETYANLVEETVEE